MPRISAATVAEHRVAQRAALISAGADVLRGSGLSAVTPRAVCERAGLSRSSFYDYFPGKDDLLVAIAIEAIESWDADVEQALAGVEPGLPELRAFVDATMAMTADGKHDIAGALREADINPSSFDDLMRLHDALLRPATRVLDDLGVADAATAVWLLNGVLGAGIQLVTHGADHRKVADDVYQLLTRGLFADAR